MYEKLMVDYEACVALHMAKLHLVDADKVANPLCYK